jgi:ABC-type branched-subunit amino acid transport system substrate-binding protein
MAKLKAVQPFIFLGLFCLTSLVADCQTRVAKIGVMTDASAKMAEFGRQTFLGAQLAEQELNTEGIPTKVYYEDVAMDTGRSVSAATKFINVDQVAAIYAEFTPIAAAISPIMIKDKKILLHRTGGNAIVTSNPYSFKSYVDFTDGCEAITRYFTKQGLKKVATLRIAMETGEICYEGVTRVIQPELDFVFNPSAVLSTEILKAKQQAVELVVIMGYEPDLLNALKAMQDLNYTPKIATIESAVTVQVVNKFPTLSKNIFAFGMPKASLDFVSKLQKLDPKNSLVSLDAAASAYVHVKQLAKVILDCPDNDIECQISKLELAQPDATTSFTKWKQHKADFPPALRTWTNGIQAPIELN